MPLAKHSLSLAKLPHTSGHPQRASDTGLSGGVASTSAAFHLPGCDTGDWYPGSEAGFVGTLALPTPRPPARPLTSLSRSLQLMEALKEQEEINFRLRQYMDKIILAILDHNPSILEIKH